MNKDYKNLVSLKPVKAANPTNTYEIGIKCDANDGDYMEDTIDCKDIYLDELFFLVLCYLRSTCYSFCIEKKGYGKSAKYGPCDSRSAVFGHHVDEDVNFAWLSSYLINVDLLIFAGMCDSHCHSIVDLDICYYDKDGKPFNVLLPEVVQIFTDQKEMKDYMNNLAIQAGYE